MRGKLRPEKVNEMSSFQEIMSVFRCDFSDFFVISLIFCNFCDFWDFSDFL